MFKIIAVRGLKSEDIDFVKQVAHTAGQRQHMKAAYDVHGVFLLKLVLLKLENYNVKISYQ